MIRREFFQTAGLATGTLFLSSILKAVDVFGMANEDNHLQIATDPDFNDVVLDATGYAFPEQVPGGLVPGQLYYWRQIRVVGSGQVLVYHGSLLGEQFQDLIDLYNDDLIPFIQTVSEEPVPPLPTDVTICHIPPGNPAKARTLVIPVADLEDHLGHGDTLGPCEPGTAVDSGESKKKTGKGASLPERFELGGNYPNPFSSYTTIPVALPEDARVRLTVFNVLGQEIDTVVDVDLRAGWHQVIWNAGTNPSGTYFLSMQAGTFRETRRLVISK